MLSISPSRTLSTSPPPSSSRLNSTSMPTPPTTTDPWAPSSATKSVTASTTKAASSTPKAGSPTGGPGRPAALPGRQPRARRAVRYLPPVPRSCCQRGPDAEREHRRRRWSPRRLRRLPPLPRRLPDAVKDGFTGDQRFFISYAQSWRAKIREPSSGARFPPRPRSRPVPRRHRPQPGRLVPAFSFSPAKNSTCPRPAGAHMVTLAREDGGSGFFVMYLIQGL